MLNGIFVSLVLISILLAAFTGAMKAYIASAWLPR